MRARPSLPVRPSRALLSAMPGVALLVAGAAQDAPPAELPAVLLPESAAARAWAGVDPATVPAELPAELAELGDGVWDDPRGWRLWGELLAAERDAAHPDPARRAALCLLAYRQGRTVDAWDHFATLTASPPHAAAVLPYLVPGVPATAGVVPGGRAAPLPAGVVLRPAAPPAPNPERPFGPRDAEVHHLRVGAGTIGMIVRFETSGIEIEVSHEGPEGDAPVDVAIVIPEPEGLRMFVEYTDWSREEDLGVPRAITVRPGEEPLSLYGRFVARDATEPTGHVERIPDRLQRGGLVLEGAAGAGEDPLLAGAAAALQGLLGFPVVVREAGEAADEDTAGPSGTVVRLAPGAPGAAGARADGAPDERGGADSRRARRLAYLASRVEELLLRR